MSEVEILKLKLKEALDALEAAQRDAALYQKLKCSNWYVGPQPTCEYAAFVDYEDRNCGELDAALEAMKGTP